MEIEPKKARLEMHNSDFNEEVDIDSESTNPVTSNELTKIKQGAEACLYRSTFFGRPALIKERFSKKYRISQLDSQLTKDRHKAEIKAIAKCRQIGLDVPTLLFVDNYRHWIVMEYIENSQTAKEFICQSYESCKKEFIDKKLAQDQFESEMKPLAVEMGKIVAIMHKNNIIHGDLTTSNMLIRDGDPMKIVLIDFGLSYVQQLAEDKGVDLFVLEKALISTHPNSEQLFCFLLESYQEKNTKGSVAIIKKLNEVRERGRKREMTG